jgi:DnaJ-class molecular chaperone
LSEFAAYVQASVVEGGSILPPPCETCDGSGTVTEGYRDEYGSVVEQEDVDCPDCHGFGDC